MNAQTSYNLNRVPNSPQLKLKVVWPKKIIPQLADAASKLLNEIPANAANPISSHQIRQILLQGPRFIELCERLERSHLTFNREALAHVLLGAVWDSSLWKYDFFRDRYWLENRKTSFHYQQLKFNRNQSRHSIFKLKSHPNNKLISDMML
jgi:hypothetical protein